MGVGFLDLVVVGLVVVNDFRCGFLGFGGGGGWWQIWVLWLDCGGWWLARDVYGWLVWVVVEASWCGGTTRNLGLGDVCKTSLKTQKMSL